MSYIINNSRGNIVAIVADGTVNTTATDLALVGRAVTAYGTYENENYVYLLENFANSTAPVQPILGQLWYNSTTDVISSYSTANTWVAMASQDYVQAQKISPAFTGTPTAPTAANGTSTTQLATTAFVLNQLGSSNSIVSVGNITGGNLLTSGIVSAAGSITSSISILTNGTISATGNITGANFVGNVVGNVSGGNVVTPGILSATGNVYGANFIGNLISPAGAAISTTGNVTGGNILTGGTVTSVVVTSTGNITGANLRTSGIVSATGNVYGANFVGNVTIPAGSPVSTTGNINGGNILTSGIISATGNITTVNTIIADRVIANTVITNGTTSAFRLPNLTQTQINALSPQNGDMVYNTTTDLPQVYQSGAWRDFTIAYYS
jgi:hypothetical protein